MLPINLELGCLLGVTCRDSLSYKAVQDEPGRIHERHKVKGFSRLPHYKFIVGEPIAMPA